MGKWILFTFLGWLVGIFLLILLSSILDSMGIENMQFYIGLGLGGGVGFMQWRILKSKIHNSSQWIWSSVIGLGLPFLVLDLLRYFTGRSLGDYYLPVSITTAGLLTGFLQSRVLNDRRWVLYCLLGWCLGAATVISMDYLKGLSHNNWVMFAVNLFLILFGGVVLGLVTNLGLKKNLQS